ncbi:predicted protein [Botrytis cinerea T4]|uniref:Uncharacterized protein n=1 Tax=Botryotinia fuckeliana (strain T4) TaxID=999810 RepID=G2Y7N9_BOTF4|nr:predicted protein [Botrytis cinerea T4]
MPTQPSMMAIQTHRSNRGVDYMSRGQDGNARYLSRYHHIQIG